ncbi:MAG TPA: 3-oxoacyl-[acyl-carrier-protein] reductase [Stellaceae bacterium]|nr:3-oxoacyl-[acyl-carrier-protein] reductase [Stellaceae bacterium]
MFSLVGRTALVTGASGAIGGAIARALHGAGAKVLLAGTRRAALDQLSAELGDGTHVATGDLADPATAETLVKAAEDAMGQLDVLVNNAGMTRDGLILRMKDEDWLKVLEVDLSAAFRLSRAALRGMVRRRWGRIISVGSVVGATGNPGQANYAAAKAGLVGLTKAVAAEVASRGITANCIAPGFIASAMTEALSAEQRERLAANIPMGRVGTPEEVGCCALFLASEEARYITGQTLHVNGGLAMF